MDQRDGLTYRNRRKELRRNRRQRARGVAPIATEERGAPIRGRYVVAMVGMLGVVAVAPMVGSRLASVAAHTPPPVSGDILAHNSSGMALGGGALTAPAPAQPGPAKLVDSSRPPAEVKPPEAAKPVAPAKQPETAKLEDPPKQHEPVKPHTPTTPAAPHPATTTPERDTDKPVHHDSKPVHDDSAPGQKFADEPRGDDSDAPAPMHSTRTSTQHGDRPSSSSTAHSPSKRDSGHERESSDTAALPDRLPAKKAHGIPGVPSVIGEDASASAPDERPSAGDQRQSGDQPGRRQRPGSARDGERPSSPEAGNGGHSNLRPSDGAQVGQRPRTTSQSGVNRENGSQSRLNHDGADRPSANRPNGGAPGVIRHNGGQSSLNRQDSGSSQLDRRQSGQPGAGELGRNDQDGSAYPDQSSRHNDGAMPDISGHHHPVRRPAYDPTNAGRSVPGASPSGSVGTRGEAGAVTSAAPTAMAPAQPAPTPAQPAQVPAQIPVQSPAQAPAQLPAQVPAQSAQLPTYPAQVPPQQPAQAPAQLPAQAPAQLPSQQPAQSASPPTLGTTAAGTSATQAPSVQAAGTPMVGAAGQTVPSAGQQPALAPSAQPGRNPTATSDPSDAASTAGPPLVSPPSEGQTLGMPTLPPPGPVVLLPQQPVDDPSPNPFGNPDKHSTK